jgi:hypothetical protein
MDGWTCFVSNDTEPNKLYQEQPQRHVSQMLPSPPEWPIAMRGRPAPAWEPMQPTTINSGWQSLVIGNFTNEGLALYHNDGSGLVHG